MRLNKYLANAGICSRRDADLLIKKGKITINDAVVRDLSYQVKPDDVVTYEGKAVSIESKVYIVLNKPKDYITTLSDERGRKTVRDLIGDDITERVYPIGRLDRNTTGLLLLTNDGALAEKLSHPRYNVMKIYRVFLDRKLQSNDLNRIRNGLELEDGFIKVDDVSYIRGEPKHTVHLTLHSGKNRIVRRIFEHIYYEVKRLDRVAYAGLTKDGIALGTWRRLTHAEIAHLKAL